MRDYMDININLAMKKQTEIRQKLGKNSIGQNLQEISTLNSVEVTDGNNQVITAR